MTSITNSSINNAFEAFKTAASGDEQVKALNTLKVTELRELAKWQSIRLTGKTRKADIIEAVIDGMRQNVIHFMENAMLGTRKSLNITRENLNENLNSAYLDNGYSFTPETIKTFAKAFYNIELGQGDALDLTREFLTKINSKIFKLVAHFDELDEAEAEDEPEDSLKAQFLADCFKDDLKACTKLSEVMKVINEFKLTAENFVELVSPYVEIKLAGGALNAAVQYCEAFNLELDDDPDDDPNNNAMRKPEAEVEDEDGQASAAFMAKLDELDQKGGDAPRSRNSGHQANVLNKSADELQKILSGDLSLSEKEAVLDGYGKNLLRQLYVRYVKQPLTDSMDKFTMIRDIMFSIELDTPDLIDFDVKKRMLKAGSKAERIEILERCTRYALLDFAKWKHESLNDVPEISPEIEDRRSVLAKCIARLKDDNDLSAAD